MTWLKGQLHKVEGTLAGSIASGAAELESRSSLVLRIEDSEGGFGLGEASPLPGYSPDELEQAERELFPICARGLEVQSATDGLRWLEAVLEARVFQSPAAKFALETALLDWFGKRRGLALHRLLGEAVDDRRLPIARLVPHRDAGQWLDWVRTHAGPKATVKLKVGAAFDAELRALLDLRAAFPTLRIRLDANRQLQAEQVLAAAEALRELQLELFEEPVAREDWPRVLGLPLPFAFDESLRDESRWADFLLAGSISSLVLKPTVLGGLLECRRLADRARTHGLRCVVSHCFDGPIARAAMAELALSLEPSRSPGIDVHPALALWPSHEIAAIRDGELRRHEAPGLGLRFLEPFDV